MVRIQPLITRLRSYTARISSFSYALYYDCFLTDRIRWKTAKHGRKMKYLTVYGTVKYGRNTVHIKRVKYDRKQQCTIGRVWPERARRKNLCFFEVSCQIWIGICDRQDLSVLFFSANEPREKHEIDCSSSCRTNHYQLFSCNQHKLHACFLAW